jgi:hypothetical protein
MSLNSRQTDFIHFYEEKPLLKRDENSALHVLHALACTVGGVQEVRTPVSDVSGDIIENR